MSFHASTYANFIAHASPAQSRLFLQYLGPRDDFDIIIIGSGIGGGVLADDLADRLGGHQRILVLEAGSFVYPTHVYNFCRFSNAAVARHFACDTFWQTGHPGAENYLGEMPQLNFGGRSIFWSGLIPTVQDWELEFFPERVRHDLRHGWLTAAGATMNESRSLGATAQAMVHHLRQSPLAADFVIEQTPRALHQPYLRPDGTPGEEFFQEPTGVFNTAELLINQASLTPGLSHGDHAGFQLLLNHYVEDLQHHGSHYAVVARNTLTQAARTFRAGTVVLAAGSIESPKLLRRSSLYPWLPDAVKPLVGRGLTDHPTSNESAALVTHLGGLPLPKSSHAKIILYSRGLRDGGAIRYPFNVEMNLNHEYWHLRENDPHAPAASFSTNDPAGPSRLDLKFSFGNCLDDCNEVKAAPPFGYVPEVWFRNLSWMDHLSHHRFPALANWHKSNEQIFAVLNHVTHQIFSQFSRDGTPARPADEAWYGQNGKGFGWGTVHHAAGTLRMPYRTHLDGPFHPVSVLDEDLRVAGHHHLYVCDMSVLPFSSAANPVRTLVALALRLSRHFG